MASKGQKFDKYSEEFKKEVYNAYISGEYGGYRNVAKKYNIPLIKKATPIIIQITNEKLSIINGRVLIPMMIYKVKSHNVSKIDPNLLSACNSLAKKPSNTSVAPAIAYITRNGTV